MRVRQLLHSLATASALASACGGSTMSDAPGDSGAQGDSATGGDGAAPPDVTLDLPPESDAGAEDSPAEEAASCDCPPDLPADGAPCCAPSGSVPCKYLVCPAGEFWIATCVDDSWTTQLNGFDYQCPDAGK